MRECVSEGVIESVNEWGRGSQGESERGRREGKEVERERWKEGGRNAAMEEERAEQCERGRE